MPDQALENTPTNRYKNTLNTPHLVDWLFSDRLNEFLKAVFDDMLHGEWRWHW